MTATMMSYPLTTDHLLKRAYTLFPSVEIVSQRPDKTLRRDTYADLWHRSRALARGLCLLGLGKGERVATLMWNHHAHLEAYFGIPMAGGVYHTLNLRLSPKELAFICRHANDRVLIVDDILLPLLERFEAEVPFEKVLVVPLSGEPLPDERESYEHFLSQAASSSETLPQLAEEDGAGMCYTSGTTGHPKGVIYSHRSLVLHSFASAMTDTVGLCQADTVLPVVPMFHANAWGLPFTATMTGTKQVHPGPHLDPESLLDLYEKEAVTISAGVPTIWLGIQKALEADRTRWKLQSDMRMVVGGSAAPEALIRSMDELGLRVVHAWGMTETTPIGTVSTLKTSLASAPEDDRYRSRAKQGLPLPFFDIRAQGEQGPVPWDGVAMGELEVRSPWVASSYHNLPEGSDRWTDDGWFRTGDVVTIDPEGYMQIADRTKDLIKSGGEWISSVALENALLGHPTILEAAVIAIPHEKWLERPLAVVVPKPGQHVDGTELNAFLTEQGFEKYWLPDGYVTRNEIPRTSTGKFLKSKLREELQDWGQSS